MNYFEEKFIYTYPNFKAVVWLRFFDDIFCVWEGTKFTVEKSRSHVSFLDTMVHLENGRLWTDLFCKETDSHNYIYFTSAHPKHCKTSFPNSQLLRLKRICTFERDFMKHRGMLLSHFQRRGYPIEILHNAMDKVET